MRWRFPTNEVERAVQAAVGAFGAEVLAPGPDGEILADWESTGRRLLRLAFGPDDGELPETVRALVNDPDNEDAGEELFHEVYAALNRDPAKAEAASDLIVGLCRRRAAAGDAQSLVDLGDLLRRDDPDGARAAYQQAVDAGHLRALFDLAEVTRKMTGRDDAALAFYRQAAASADPDLAAEALDRIVGVHLSAGDVGRADAVLAEVIDFGRPEWAAAALGRVARSRSADDPTAAEALYRQAIDLRAGQTSTSAAIGLGELLEKSGDVTGAKVIWRRLVDARDWYWAGGAFLSLVNLARKEQDVDGLRALHQVGVELDNPDALYALDQLGEVLIKQGDTEGAHAVWQQAIDAGYEQAADLRERISPPPQRRRRFRIENYPPELPPAFNPGNRRQTATEVLVSGLPALPPVLTPEMAIPMAYWKGEREAVVLILDYSWSHGDWSPMAWEATFTRDGDRWVSTKHWHGGGWSTDPVTEPRSLRDLLDRPMVTGGGSSRSRRGRIAPTVTEIGLIQNGHEIRRPVDSHFGAWVVWTDQPGPFTVTGYDSTGTLLASIESEDRPGRLS